VGAGDQEGLRWPTRGLRLSRLAASRDRARRGVCQYGRISEGGPTGHAARMPQAERDERSRQRRAEVLALPMTPLRLHGHLDRPDHHPRAPVAVGVGTDDVAVAAWPPPAGERGVVVTSHDGSGPYSKERYRSQIVPRVTVLDVLMSLAVTHVQPLPAGRILVACARTQGTDNAEVWDGSGRLEQAGLIGDAIAHLLATPSGAIWAGYFDEGIFGTAPAAHGLIRFTPGLAMDWAYSQREMPTIDDCYALNVCRETVSIGAYSAFRLVTVKGDQARNHGPLPRRGASKLLIAGERAALIGGCGPEYDLITPLQVTPAGVVPHGPERRLVQPDGMEIPRAARAFCRGPILSLFPRDSAAWYRLNLDECSLKVEPLASRPNGTACKTHEPRRQSATATQLRTNFAQLGRLDCNAAYRACPGAKTLATLISTIAQIRRNIK
jgi:hypothetical protein